GFASTVQAKTLDRLETVLRRLEPPVWPASFPAPVQARVDEGRALFQTMCQGCHQAPPAGTSVFEVHMMPLSRDSHGTPNRNNTDPWMACNALSYTSNTGKLQGTRDRYISGNPLPANAPLASMLSTSVIATIIGDWREILSSTAQTSFNVGTRDYDPVHVGYRTEPAAPGNGFTFNATGNGNSNEGHDYNVGRLTEPQRLSLLEYLKTL